MMPGAAKETWPVDADDRGRWRLAYSEHDFAWERFARVSEEAGRALGGAEGRVGGCGLPVKVLCMS